MLFDVNIKGVFYCMKYEIEEMLRTGGGSIVNTSSTVGLKGYPAFSLYSGTKHAITGMTKSAALDYVKRGIRVNAVAPGPIETPMLAKDSKTTRTPPPLSRWGGLASPKRSLTLSSGCFPMRPVTSPDTRSRSMGALVRSEMRQDPRPVRRKCRGHQRGSNRD